MLNLQGRNGRRLKTLAILCLVGGFFGAFAAVGSGAGGAVGAASLAAGITSFAFFLALGAVIERLTSIRYMMSVAVADKLDANAREDDAKASPPVAASVH